jgi:3'(2'), 5'-bisphosphate nucleotidase
MDKIRAELEFGIGAVREASLLAQQVQKEMITPALTKGDRSPVTVADFTIQAVVACLLGRNFPNDALVGEEDASALREADGRETRLKVAEFAGRVLAYASPETVCEWIDHGNGVPGPRFWTLDPVDGTKGFLRGEQYAIALALIEEGEVTAGVMGCPNLTDATSPEVGGPGSLLAAARGEGAWTAPLSGGPGDWRRLSVSEVSDPAQTRMLRSVEKGHTNVGEIGDFIEHLGVKAEPVCLDSQAKYAVLASGAGDLILRLISKKAPDYKECVWDQAAGALIAEEAGGRVTDLTGKKLDFTTGKRLTNNTGVCASNGHLHEAALAALNAVGY